MKTLAYQVTAADGTAYLFYNQEEADLCAMETNGGVTALGAKPAFDISDFELIKKYLSLAHPNWAKMLCDEIDRLQSCCKSI